jgi:hypothetical protein
LSFVVGVESLDLAQCEPELLSKRPLRRSPLGDARISANCSNSIVLIMTRSVFMAARPSSEPDIHFALWSYTAGQDRLRHVGAFSVVEGVRHPQAAHVVRRVLSVE